MYREQFPLLKKGDLTYLDSSATTQKPQVVLDRLDHYYRSENANVHRTLYPLGEAATGVYEESRKTIQHFLNAPSEKEIIFTSGTTGSLNQLAFSFSETLEPGDHIMLTEMEHHSNLVPWQLAAQRRGLELDFIPLTDEHRLNLDWMKTNWHKRTKIVSLTHVSNLLGTVNPLEEIISFAHQRGAFVAIDAAQSAARIPLDVEALDCDFLALSGHKVYGPTGIGILYGKKDLLESLPPWQGGGDMISSVSLTSSTWNELPLKFEAGTPNIAGALGLGSAIGWIEQAGRETLYEHEKSLTSYGHDILTSIGGVEVYGPGGEDHLGVISFNIKGLHAHDTVQFLSAENLALRAGHHCAQPLIRRLGVPSTVRASFGAYNDKRDVDHLAGAIEKTRDFFTKRGIL